MRSLRDWTLFVAGVNFALRISDLRSLTIGDVCDGGGQVREKFNIQQKKTGKPVSVHMPPNAREAIEVYLAEAHPDPDSPTAPLFPSRKKQNGELRPISAEQAYRVLNTAVHQFEPNLAVGTHTLRKTWGWFAFNSCVPLEVIMQKLGHKSPASTLRYLGIRDDEVKEATETLNL